MYDIAPYYLSKMISEMPVYIILPIINTPILYFWIGFTVTWAQYFGFMLAVSAQI